MGWERMEDELRSIELVPTSVAPWLRARDALRDNSFSSEELLAVYKRIAAYGFTPTSYLATAQREMVEIIELRLGRILPPIAPYSVTSPKPRGRPRTRYSRTRPSTQRDKSHSVRPVRASRQSHARPSTSTPVYHITHVDNLRGIVDSGGLLSHARLATLSDSHYVDISDGQIQAKRARRLIPCWEPCPTVDQFVPLAFRPCPLMLRQVALGRDIAYAGGTAPIVHLVFLAEDIHCAGIDYAVSDRHPVSSLAQWAFSIEGMHGLLDWQLIQGHLLDKGDPRHSYQMAEFLVRDQVPWHLVQEVAVMTEAMRPRVTEALERAAHRPLISVRPEWYP